jgi:hypothetical protein
LRHRPLPSARLKPALQTNKMRIAVLGLNSQKNR